MKIKLNRNRRIAGVSLITAILMLFLLMLTVLVGYVLWLWIWANFPNVPPPPGVSALHPGTNTAPGATSSSTISNFLCNPPNVTAGTPLRLVDVPTNLVFNPVQLLPAVSNVSMVYSTNLVDWYPLPASITNLDSYSVDPRATNALPHMYFRLKLSL